MAYRMGSPTLFKGVFSCRKGTVVWGFEQIKLYVSFEYSIFQYASLKTHATCDMFMHMHMHMCMCMDMYMSCMSL